MIVVPFTTGAATPSQVALAATSRGHDTTFVVDPSDPDASAHVRLLEAWGSVIEASTASDAIRALEGRPAAVVTFADVTLPITATIAEHYDLPGHSPTLVECYVDKAVQRRRLNACGVSDVDSVGVVGGQPEEDLSSVPLPGVLKPRAGAGSRDTSFVTCVAEVAEELARHPADSPFVVERRIEGMPSPIHPWLADYVSVESAVIGEELYHLGCTGRLPLAEPARETGLVFPVIPEAVLLEQLHDVAEAAAAALEIRYGLIHTEMMIGPHGPRVIEVNARLGGGLAAIVPAAGGPDVIGLAVDLALGRPVQALPIETGVALHLYVQPPSDVTGLVTAPEPRALRALPGVFGVDRRAVPGAAIDWRSGSAGRILDVWVEAATLEELQRRTDTIEALLAATTQWARS